MPRQMFELEAQFAPDAIEKSLVSPEQALALIAQKRADLIATMQEIGSSYLQHFGEQYRPQLVGAQKALALSFARMASRHGSWGDDFHDYHNEEHALELLNGRLARIRLQFGWDALAGIDWLIVTLFATCHDLRQRESGPHVEGVGPNERASIAETIRILDASGFDRERDHDFYLTLCYAIAGSTFDARPAQKSVGSDVLGSGGSLAPSLVAALQRETPHWTTDAILQRRFGVMLLAADLDTANVGEPLPALAMSAVRLVREREMRAGRTMDQPETAAATLQFLTAGQETYFFQLHRFVSDLGRSVFGVGKSLNGTRLKRLTDHVGHHFVSLEPDVSGARIVNFFLASARAIAAQ
jgi:hypothetical protein